MYSYKNNTTYYIYIYIYILSRVYNREGDYPTSYQVAQPCEKYLSWEDGENYMLDHKPVHKATSMLIMWIATCRKTYKNGEVCSKWRQVMISTWSLPLMLVHKVKSNSSSRSPDSFVSFWIWQWKITFTNCRGLESATWVDKWGKRCTERIHDGVVAPPYNVVTWHLLSTGWLRCEYYYKGHVLFTGLCYTESAIL